MPRPTKLLITIGLSFTAIAVISYPGLIKGFNDLKLDVIGVFENSSSGSLNADYYDLIKENIIRKNDFSTLDHIGKGIYVFRNGNEAEFASQTTDGQEEENFNFLEFKSEFLPEQSFYLIRKVFSHKIKPESVELENFLIEKVDLINQEPGPPESTPSPQVPPAETENPAPSDLGTKIEPESTTEPESQAEPEDSEEPKSTIETEETSELENPSELENSTEISTPTESADTVESGSPTETESLKDADISSEPTNSANSENSTEPSISTEPENTTVPESTLESESVADPEIVSLELPHTSIVLAESGTIPPSESTLENTTNAGSPEISESTSSGATQAESSETPEPTTAMAASPEILESAPSETLEPTPPADGTTEPAESTEIPEPTSPADGTQTENPGINPPSPPASEKVFGEVLLARRPQFIIIHENVIISGFVVDLSELSEFNTLHIKEVSSSDDQIITDERIILPTTTGEIFSNGESANPPTLNPKNPKEADPEADPQTTDETIDAEEALEIEKIKNSETDSITFNEDRKKVITRFVINQYTNENYKKSLQKLDKRIYYFDEKFLGRSAGKTLLKGDEEGFFILEQHEEFLVDQGLYYVNTVFSQKINYEDLNLQSFILEGPESTALKPKLVLASDYEAIFIFETDKSLNGKLAKIADISSTDDPENPLDGYLSLEAVDSGESYKEVKSSIKRKYSAYIDKDIVFKTKKISFGKFHSAVESDSTIALEIGNTEKLDKQCAILVFGNDLEQKAGTGAVIGAIAGISSSTMPISGLSLVSKSSGDLPVDSEIVEKMAAKKQKKFLGFTYFNDLEIINSNRILYLNLSSPAGLNSGAYESTLSVELFCP